MKSVPLLEALREAIAVQLGIDPDEVRADSRLAEDLLLGSLDVVEIVDRINATSGVIVVVEPSERSGEATVEQFANRLRPLA